MQPLALLLTLLPAQATPDFDTEVVPVLTRAGCNSGACHGAAAGRGGLRLSLWGSDPASDHDALTRELKGRRVNLARPERSLLLLKPTGRIEHGGGRKLVPDGPGAERILHWLKAGAERTPRRKLVRLVITPAEALLSRPGEGVTLRATAEFDDRSREDVTGWTVFSADDPGSLDVDRDGSVRVLRPGQHIVLARFLDRVIPVRLVLPVGRETVDLNREERRNFIDDEILSTLSTLHLRPAPIAGDAAFLRRVSLDLAGTLPSPDEVLSFIADPAPDKRERLIDRLLVSHDFNDLWALRWAMLLRIQSRSLGPDGARRYHGWLREQIVLGVPFDRMTRDLLTATGDARRVGPANFARVPADPREQAELTARAFLGVRLQCANCHNHPLDRWTQDDYHGLAAVFARLERGPVVRVREQGEVIHPRSGEAAIPRLPGERFLKAEGDQREELARWLTSPDNRLFARAAVNRLWRELMGRGLVEPADDLRETNPATHPRLLDRLADDFVRHGFDTRRTLRLIATSVAYQRGPRGSLSEDDRYYSHALSRPLAPEVLADAIVSVTGVPDRHGDLPAGTRAIALTDPLIPSPTLDVLGRCSRTKVCEEGSTRAGLARKLALINGPLLNQKLAAPQGRLRQMLDHTKPTGEIVEDFYLRALGRRPTAKERAFWNEKLAGDDRAAALEDFLWALLTCREFTTID